uniref:schlafen family member 12-like n=1 Tax=Jaculus jaculus TaxID=51337 RepID=UPI001E1AF528|nr:schlafen family member 12-like [Jaculus jaculus]
MDAGEMNIHVDLTTDFADLVLDVGAVTLGNKDRHAMKDCQLRKKETENVLRAVCVLLNSGGGVIKAKIANQNYCFSRDGIGLDLENSFRAILPLVQKYLDFVQKEDHFYVLVKSWDLGISALPIVTLKTNLYIRNISSSLEMDAGAAAEFLQDTQKLVARPHTRTTLPENRDFHGAQEKCHVEDLATKFFNMTKLTHKGKFPFSKSTHVEIKLFPIRQLLRQLKEILPQTISAFANTDGGYLFIGIDGKKQQIIGFEAEKSDLEKLEREVEKCISQLPVYHFCEQKEKIKYSCKFIEVHNDTGTVCSYVCALAVERFCCAVFAKEPDSWHMEGNCVKTFATEEWVTCLMRANGG